MPSRAAARLALVVGLAVAGCSRPRPAPPPTTGVAFALYLDTSVLAVGSQLVVTTLDPSAGGCSKYDGMDEQPPVAPCPQMPDQRETVVLTVPAPGEPLIVPSTMLTIGRAYTLSVAGVAVDGCSRVNGSTSGTIAASTVEVRSLALVATPAPCPS